MSYLNALLKDLRDRKLWPVAALLLVAIVAVPLLLAGGSAPAPQTPLPSAGLAVAQTHTGAAVTVDSAPIQVALHGHERDPFIQQNLPSAVATQPASTGAGSTVGSGGVSSASAGSSAGSTGSSGAASGASATGSSGSSGSGSASGGVTSIPPVLPVNPAGGTSGTSGGGSSATVARNGLLPTQSYDIALSITTPGGGVATVDPLQRLSVLPSASRPLLVELGVLKGGSQVLFAVQPGTQVSGPGVCTPGPLDCEILSLGVGQTETITGPGAGSTMFAVTGITVADHPTAAAGAKARAASVAAGAKLLAASHSRTLPLFQYDPQLGVVLDQRNLTVGGN